MHVLGTAGHVDHGKSTLIHALTGIDPDRLAEEKSRGLTIDLGFAWLTLPSGRDVGIVDVPGHERFVHNMLAGAGSIDATIFVVAANEGWMPQSEEHLQIIDLLGARGGLVALTKIDAVDDDTAALVTEEIRERIAGTVLDDAPVVRVSARTGDGLDALVKELDLVLDRTPASPDRGRPRAFVDRSFSIKGAGTVVTGTLTHGTLRVDDEVEILPSGVRARIRGIQSHRRARDHAEPGSRVALNLAGIDRHEIHRGDVVVAPRQWKPTSALGVRVRGVRSLAHALTSRGAYKLYLGAAEVDARVTLLDTRDVRARGQAYARIRLLSPVVATEGDRFVLRDRGRDETVAGGVVLDAHPMPGRASGAILLERLQRRATTGANAVHERGAIPLDDLVALTGTAQPAGVVMLRSYAVDQAWLDDATTRIAAALAEHHARESLARGMPRDEARRAAGIADARLFSEIVEHRADLFASEGSLLSVAGRAVQLTPEQQRQRTAVLAATAGTAPPALADLEQRFGAKLVRALIDAGDLVKIDAALVFTADSLAEAKRAIADAIAKEGPSPASRLREVLRTSRKYAIPLLEHLDATGFTKREGDLRRLRS